VSEASDHWARVDALCQAALEVPESERDAFLLKACDDPNQRREAQEVLAYASRAERFLESPLAASVTSVMPATTASLTGTRMGPFEIGPFLGAGGMGEVYRARDTRLNRDVALKILPLTFALASDRLERFRREAQALAALNHPNIGAIYGLEESAGVHALVLELVEGQTLADRLEAGPIPLDEAIPIGRQIAEGLEAAHERGIVHNDLKPQNITRRSDGAVKVLDFGLATVMRSVRNVTDSESATPPAASTTIFATPAYASPEQLKGVGDKRSDIWAFGAVMYEMLSGKQAFGARGWRASAANVDWNTLPAATPEMLRRLIQRCLEPDARQRLRDIGEARIILEDRALVGRPASDALVPSSPMAPRPWGWWVRMAAVAATLGGAVSAGTLLTRVPTPSVARVSVMVPAGQSLSTGDRRIAAVSPDGTQIVYVAAPAGLYLRSLSASEAIPIPGADAHGNIGEPVFSPDGQSILFHALGDQTIKRIPVSGGAASIVCPAVFAHGVSWTDEGILFVEPGRGIVRVTPAGGRPEVIVSLASDRAAQSPQLLPGGGRVLYTLATGTGPDRWDRARIVLRTLSSGEEVTLVEGGSAARYVPTGHLVYAVGGNLFAVPFDLSRMSVDGAASQVVQGVRRGAPAVTGTAQFDVAGNGTLMYVPGAASADWDLGVTDRKGTVERLRLPSGSYEAPRASPDGRRIAFGTDDGREAIVWVYDLDRATPARRLTFGGNARFPTWSRDGKQVAFQFDRDGDAAIFWQAIDGRPAERLTRPAEGEAHEPEAWAPSWDDLVFSSTKANEVTLRVLSLKTRTTSRFSDVRSSTRTGAVFSPDGQWLAYARSDSSGKTIYVEPFPATGTKYQLAVPGARQPNHPLWSPHGTELFYNPGPGRFEVVPVTTAPTFAFGNPVAVPRFFPGASTQTRRPFDVLPDGRFVSPIAAGAASSSVQSVQEIRVVLNWFTELTADRQ
jgi:Tol biopolymer transport system component